MTPSFIPQDRPPVHDVIAGSPPKKLLQLALEFYRNSLYRHTLQILTVLFCVGTAILLSNLSQLSDHLVQVQARNTAQHLAHSNNLARSLYSETVLQRLSRDANWEASASYHEQPNAIPLPFTFAIELGEQMSVDSPGSRLNIYSDYPFKQRAAHRPPLDTFERDALDYFVRVRNQNPGGDEALAALQGLDFTRQDTDEGQPVFRYAEPIVMEASCVQCHNTHPDSLKRDWKIGDVRGAIEVVQPLRELADVRQSGLRRTLLLCGGMSAIALVGLTSAIRSLYRTSIELEGRVRERTADLAYERERSEQLLLKILPASIANKLKASSGSLAEQFDEVSILFADVVGFTALSEQISPRDLVALLDNLFSRFDSLTETLNLEKIKTIGDAYMVASGIPQPRSDHAEAIAMMAIGIQQEVQKFNQERGTTLSIRIGINSGPVVAGVIGRKKFLYDLWGDAVNTASRMESYSAPGAIQVSETTMHKLKAKFVLEKRGDIDVKGKGKMTTYWLLGTRR